MELEVLKGAQKTISKHKPIMTVVAKTEELIDAVHQELENLGYTRLGGKRPYEIWGPYSRD
jgi:hypothetical protein